MDIKKVAVIGGGTMGNGIAHVFAMNEIPVHLVETSQELADKALATIEKNLERMVEKAKIDSVQKIETLDNIKTYTNLVKGVEEADLVVEAVPEVLDLKKEVFQKVDEAVSEDTILASNTSSISITKLAAVTGRPDRFIGMHFFNPVPIMTLVELVKGLETSSETFESVEQISKLIDKTPVEAEDSPGFVSNRVLMPMINEAIFCVHEGVAEPEDVDTVMKLGMNHPMGPLRLADFIGLDVCLDIMEVLYDGFKDPKYRPCPLLVKMVNAGKLGNKTGEGFYVYD
ncbi:3-hydroxybutyryl-CoA dehydrogenase [Aliifodinibius sp. S!AR15-10]|uniref:3-hydroxyacyl-CoA dehydrogenase family protein n=1 Tax=Aliifodinibius sp. S!AR15-10 TaxID=2950437 RepID=UPI0028674233|nr:3-hydroxybutyryl-CoA dehydrogenase [Aliifodinibius sp. S!AR15-10]MDR8390507.1 3-hydroxybutyryl-CoA dehydrogenase [Aliifodinibius sp. S!AR15-10]